MKREKVSYSIKAVDNALDVLEQFLCDDDELGVTELGRRLRLPKNNVFRLLTTLESHDFVEQNTATKNYRLGLKNMELGQIAARQISVQRNARPVLEGLVRDCNETSDVAVLQKGQIIYLDVVESDHPIRVVPRIGFMLPLHCTATGKVLLAGADKRWRSPLSNGQFMQYTSKSICNPIEFEKKLEETATRGFAIEDEELNSEVRSIAAPIRDYTRCVVGAVSVTGPLMRFCKERMEDELVPMVKRAAAEISSRLGYCFSVDNATIV